MAESEEQKRRAGFKLRGIRAVCTCLETIAEQARTQSVAQTYVTGSTPESILDAHEELYRQLKNGIESAEELRLHYANNDWDENSK